MAKKKASKQAYTPLERQDYICVKGARVNNLKGIDLEIKRGQFVVVTGVSGSGKSSLAFDTLYAEGQRRYVESLSAYVRQFLGRMPKPDVDWIRGLPPAVAIEQRVISRNPRSTVATSTEIYEYMRILYARIGKMISPKSGTEVKKHTSADVVAYAEKLPIGSRLYLLVSLCPPKERSLAEHLAMQMQQGYTRLWLDEGLISIEDYLAQGRVETKEVPYLLIDRLVYTGQESLTKLAESAEVAFFEGRGRCTLRTETKGGETNLYEFSNIFEADGRIFQEPTAEMFSFNNALGACTECEGFGMVMGIDENLVIPNKYLSVYEDAVACWKGTVSSEWKQWFMQLAEPLDFPIHRPYNQLSPQELKLLWEGIPVKGDKFVSTVGIHSYFSILERDIHKIQNRVRLSHFRGKTTCPSCGGGRLSFDALCVRLGGKNIAEVVRMTLSEAKHFFDTLELSDQDKHIGSRPLDEIRSRLDFLIEVGLEYLTLDRLSNTLSGGESQRITLATQLGSSLVGSLYVLDEPSIGLHQRDTSRLIGIMHRLRDLGNTVVVVEHDEEVMRASDMLIDIGPNAGRLGGEVVYAGATAEISPTTPGHTAAFLTGRERIEVPTYRRKWNSYIEVLAAQKHNLKEVNVRFPLHTLTVISGVSGSGKSTLVKEIFYEGLKRLLANEPLEGIACRTIGGDTSRIKHIEYVDQNNIGSSSRSNPCTYIGAYDEIRTLYSELPLSKQMGYKPYFFSFNKEGGRCEECKGDGVTTVEMQFMADISFPCEVCAGKRFRKELLEVEYCGKNIHQILEMSVSEAIEFFDEHRAHYSRTDYIIERLRPLVTVGLGYVKLGQASSTLSGGENQRVKLAYYLGRGKKEPTLFIFDEPTTGLHLHDIRTLLSAFNSLVDAGHSLIVVEHNLEVIKSADWVIDLGPEGGAGGGRILGAGTPEQLAECHESWTGRYLAPMLAR